MTITEQIHQAVRKVLALVWTAAVVPGSEIRDGDPRWKYSGGVRQPAPSCVLTAHTGLRLPRAAAYLRHHVVCPARVPNPSRPGNGRPPGTKNRHPTARQDVGKTAEQPESINEATRSR
nr:hypothetical protein [Streptomyces sp. WAC 06738]